MKISEPELQSFDGPPDDANDSPLPSPPLSARTPPKDTIPTSSSGYRDTRPEVLRDAYITQDSGEPPASAPIPRSPLQKIRPPATPPITPPRPSPSTATTTNNLRMSSLRSSLRATASNSSPASALPYPGLNLKQGPTDVVQQILQGERHSATFNGTSQYAAGGASACGLASMNAIRLAFELCSKIKDAEQLVSALISEKFVRAAMGIATYWPGDMHLEVEPILQLPLFSNSIRTLDGQYAQCTYRTFSNAVNALRLDGEAPTPRAVCITRPPEVISVMHIPIPASTAGVWAPRTSRQAKSIYLIFDSHPRPNHPNGAAVQIFPPRPVDVAEYLIDLFQVDQEIMNDPNLEWTVQLLGQLSYHLVAPSSALGHTDEYALNMRILESNQKRILAEENLKSVEAEARRLRSQVSDQQEENTVLSLNLRRMKDEVQRLKEQANRPLRMPPPVPKEESRPVSWFAQARRSVGSSESKGKGRESMGGWQEGPAPREETRFPARLRMNRGIGSSKPAATASGHSSGSRVNASPATRTTGTPNLNAEFVQWGREPPRPPQASTSASPVARKSSTHRKPTPEELQSRSLEVALRLQQQFDEETIQLSKSESVVREMENETDQLSMAMGESLALVMEDETGQLSMAMGESLAMAMERPKFDCGICMETFTDEAIAFIDGCGHSCCRECLRNDIQSKIEARKYPIPCPFCVAGAEDADDEQQREVGTVPAWVVETIGVSPELFEIYTEMQLAQHSVMVDCRGCSNTIFVNREDYDGTEIITCPIPTCVYTWCKNCNEKVPNRSSHKCDQRALLENLMRENGWKHCPGCRTPIERTIGCNHMACTTPGCNMHFCYLCGEEIIAGGTPNEIQEAKARHFQANCPLFEVPPEI